MSVTHIGHMTKATAPALLMGQHVLQGTSMACPQVSGAAALILGHLASLGANITGDMPITPGTSPPSSFVPQTLTSI